MTDSVFRHVDHCRAVLEQVPETFDLGTVPVRLSCIAVSATYIAIGSRCGALFLFNRRLKKSVRPLRTNYSEVVTKISLFSSDDADYLAAGHQSGTLVLLCLPSSAPGRNKKMRQNLQEDAHKGHCITSLQWTHDGSKLFSADDSGLIMVTHVNFENNAFACSFVCCQDDAVLQIAFASSRLGFVTSRKCALIDVAASCTTVIEVEMRSGNGSKSSPIGGICISGPSADRQTMFVAEGGERISVFDGLTGEFQKTIDLKQELSNLSLRYCSFTVDGVDPAQGSDVASSSSSTDISPLIGRLQKVVIGSESLLVSHDTFNVVFIDVATKAVRAVYDLSSVLTDDSEIVDMAVDPREGFVYVLTANKRVLRLSDSTAPEFLTVAHEVVSASNLLQNGLVTSYKNASKLLSTAAPASTFLLSKLMNTVDERTLNIFASREPSSDENVENLPNGAYPANIAHLIEQHKNSKGSMTNGAIEHVATDSEDIRAVQLQSESELVAVDAEPPPAEDAPLQVTRRKQRRGRKAAVVVEKPPVILENRNESEDNSLPSINEEKIRRIHAALGWGQEQEAASEQPGPSQVETVEVQEEEQKPEEVPPAIPSTSQKPDEEEEDIEKNVESGYLKILKDLEKRKDFHKPASIGNESPSTYPTESVTSVQDVHRREDSTTVRIINDQVDIWTRMPTPFVVTNFAVCSNYLVVCSPSKKARYRPMNMVHAPKSVDSSWTPLKYTASAIALNNSASIFWRIDKGIAYSPVDHDPGTPAVASKWLVQANEGGGVLNSAVTSRNVWYLTKDGIYVQMELPAMGILYRTECSWPVAQIAASDSAVWCIRADTGTLIIRSGLRHCPMGLDWVEAEPVGPQKLVSVALYEHSGWALDCKGQLWFTNGVDENNPFGTSAESWLQVCSPMDAEPATESKKFLPVAQWTIRVCAAGVFVNVGTKIFHARGPLSGHVFRHVVPPKLRLNDYFMMLAAGGLHDRWKDPLFVCRPNSEVFLFNARKKNFMSLPLFGEKPAMITMICATRSELFVLDAVGHVHVRRGIDPAVNPVGTEWVEMDLSHLTKKAYGAVLSIAVSTTSIWKLTSEGTIWCSDLKEFKWKKVDRPLQASNEKIDQIRISPSGRYVWIFASASGRSWSRRDVNDVYQSGKRWTEASNDPKICDLAVGENVVWALAQGSNTLYRLRGLAAANPAGNYWKALPARLRTISVDAAENRLWAIDWNNRIIRHETEIYPPDVVEKMDKRSAAATERDFEVI